MLIHVWYYFYISAYSYFSCIYIFTTLFPRNSMGFYVYLKCKQTKFLEVFYIAPLIYWLHCNDIIVSVTQKKKKYNIILLNKRIQKIIIISYFTNRKS